MMAHNEGLVTCYISFSNVKDVRCTYEDVMAKKLIFWLFLLLSSIVMLPEGDYHYMIA